MVAPIDAFATLPIDKSGQPILPDYTFASCPPGKWPFHQVMDESILPDKHMQGSTVSAKESLQGDPVTNGATEVTATTNKKHHKCKGKSKTRDRLKSTGATSSTSEASPNCPSQAPGPKEDLVQQDLQLSSNGSDSKIPDGTTKTKDLTRDVTGDSGFNEGSAQAESKTGPPPEAPLSHPPEETAPDHPLEVAAEEHTLDETANLDQPPDETTNLVLDQVIPNSTTEVTPQPPAALPAMGPGIGMVTLNQAEPEQLQAPPSTSLQSGV